jgi:DNA-binding NarL/FixJ family response regulator
MNNKIMPTILVVDDDKRVLKSFKLWFTNEGFNTLTASNGSDAMKLVIENTVDVAIVDFRISKEDGISVSKKLKDIDEDLKIIILTGFPSYETAVQAMKIGSFDYLSKGSSNDKIISVVKKAATERHRERIIRESDSPSDKRIKLILFCNHSLIKERLENFSKNSADFRLVKSFPMVNSLRMKNPSQEIHIALVCAGCNLRKFSDSFSVLPQLYRTFPGIKVLLINENLSDREKMELLRLGIRGFCSQDSGCETLERAIHHVAKGELWVSRRVTQMSLNEMINNNLANPHPSPDYRNFKIPASTCQSNLTENSSPFADSSKTPFGNGNHIAANPYPGNTAQSPDLAGTSSFSRRENSFGLTSKEKEILEKITQGLKNREIAEQLTISVTTVKTHINRILKKMGVDNRTKAILLAMERKIF